MSKRKEALSMMVQELIKGNSDAAAEELKKYMSVASSEILGEKEDKDEKAKKDEKPDFADLDGDGNEEESAKEAVKDKEKKGKKKVDESKEQLDELSTSMYQKYDVAADAAIDYHDKSASQMNRRASSRDASDEDKERYKGRKEKHIRKLRNREEGKKRAAVGVARNEANRLAKKHIG